MFAELADEKFLRNPNLPVSNLLHDVLKDGRIRFIGHAMDVVSVGAQGLETVNSFRTGDYYEGTLDAIDTAAKIAKIGGGKFVPLYLAGFAAETWTDVFREGRKTDWNLSGDQYAQYINPFVAKNWTETILPGAAEGLLRGGRQIWGNR
jgi:hypothetical protein